MLTAVIIVKPIIVGEADMAQLIGSSTTILVT